MKAHLLTFLLSLAIILTTWSLRGASYFRTTAHGRYYFTTTLLISTMLALITLWRLIRRPWSRTADGVHRHGDLAAENRQAYRIHYETPPTPVFVQKIGDPQSAPVFTCPVLDVSEDGICLASSGVYGKGQSVLGEIIFDSGRSAPINGVVVRETTDVTVLKLHCALSPSLLMAEQRDYIALQKNQGPRPAISPMLKEEIAGSSPGHPIKGKCRLNRP
ncbi:hypothetical protein DESC_270059 [Desulfosarcina cetonica]|nr:hypothetical protein DESC_270059 [Desulfosarcina cetonica]